MNGVSRDEARELVRDAVDELVAAWSRAAG